jgi:hypothetical protein
MMVQANLADLEEYIAVRMTAPSPLVGEGITNGRPKLNRVRGTVSQTAVRRQPLTRLRFAKPPSPTRGEGKNPAIYVRQFA